MGFASYYEDIEDRRNDALNLMKCATPRTGPQTNEKELAERVERLLSETERVEGLLADELAAASETKLAKWRRMVTTRARMFIRKFAHRSRG